MRVHSSFRFCCGFLINLWFRCFCTPLHSGFAQITNSGPAFGKIFELNFVHLSDDKSTWKKSRRRKKKTQKNYSWTQFYWKFCNLGREQHELQTSDRKEQHIWAILYLKNPLNACANTDVPPLLHPQRHPSTRCCCWQGAIPGARHAGKAFFFPACCYSEYNVWPSAELGISG